MKIGFLNVSEINFDIDTPLTSPLGGSESAVCYLSQELTRLGHEVVLFGSFSKKFKLRGINHIPRQDLHLPKWKDLDFLVIVNFPQFGPEIKQVLGKRTKLILWNQLADDQEAVACLKQKKYRKVFDGYVFVGNWQMDWHVKKFSVDPDKSIVLRNGISPKFEGLFGISDDILKHKDKPPSLIYTSAPFRGLELLINLFPIIRKKVPGTTLKVFSSMKTYQTPADKEKKDYGALYDKCRNTRGIEYHASIPQGRLAKVLFKASVFAYPNIFPETSCIAAMEAMAAGCLIVSSESGGLPETTAGFASLIEIDGNLQKYSQDFIDQTVNSLRQFKNGDKEIKNKLFSQVAFVNRDYTWTKRAISWNDWLKSLKR